MRKSITPSHLGPLAAATIALSAVATAFTLTSPAGAQTRKSTPVGPVATQPQQVPRGAAPGSVAPPCTADDKLRVEVFELSPGSSATAHPVAGRQVQILGSVRNRCTVALTNVPWQVRRSVPFPGYGAPGLVEVVLSGTFDRIAAGEEAVARGTWTAAAGEQHFIFDVDPNDTQRDPTNANNRKTVADYIVDAVPNWTAWESTAKDAARQGASTWLAGIKVRGVTAGPAAKFTKGNTLVAGQGRPFAMSVMSAGAVPSVVGSAFEGATTSAWTSWIAGYKGPDNGAAFPVFATPQPYPSPVGTAHWSGIGKLLVAHGTSSADASMSAASIEALLRARLTAGLLAQPGADDAVRDYAKWLEGHFNTWKGSAALDLSATGNVVGWTPQVPAGPVPEAKVQGKIVAQEF